MVYTMNGGTTGTFNLRIYRVDPATGFTTYDVSVDVNYGCTALDFQNALNKFDIF